MISMNVSASYIAEELCLIKSWNCTFHDKQNIEQDQIYRYIQEIIFYNEPSNF